MFGLQTDAAARKGMSTKPLSEQVDYGKLIPAWRARHLRSLIVAFRGPPPELPVYDRQHPINPHWIRFAFAVV